MNYLKKYRQEAGLAKTNENTHQLREIDADLTPTKQTMMYLNGMLPAKQSSKSTNNFSMAQQQQNTTGLVMKTPVRKQSEHQTPSAAKDRNTVQQQALRQSGIKPFNRVDTNSVIQSSSHKSIKQQAHQNRASSSKKGAMLNFEAPTNSFRVHARNNVSPLPLSNLTASRDTLTTQESKRTSKASTNQTKQYTSTKSRVTTKSASSMSTLAKAKAGTGKKTPSQSIFARKQEAYAAADNNDEFSQSNNLDVTPVSKKSKAKGMMADVRSRTPNEVVKQSSGTNAYCSQSSLNINRKKSTTHLSPKKKHNLGQPAKRCDSQQSETASEKAVKDAMMKTTQKIFFPKAFKMPGSKAAKKDAKDAQIQREQESQLEEFQQEQQRQYDEMQSVTRTVVNLEDDEELSSEILHPQTLAISQSQKHCMSQYAQENQTFCEQQQIDQIHQQQSQIVYQNAGDQTHIEPSFETIEQMVETQTNKSASKHSGGTTRRSRKNRSSNRTNTTKITTTATGRNAVTPHVYCQLQGQNSLPMTDISPLARMIPGSDTISLELDVKGMNRPNQPFLEELSGNEDNNQIPQAAQKSKMTQLPKQNVSPISRTRNNKSNLNSNTNTHTYEYRGSLNNFVQQTVGRSRTPLINAEMYTQNSVPVTTAANKGLASKIMRPVQLVGHRKNNSNTMSNSVVTPSKQQQHLSRTPDRVTKREVAAAATPNNNQRGLPARMNDLTPVRQKTTNDLTPQRLQTNQFERTRFSNVNLTKPIDRESESLEKINEVFRQISVQVFDKVAYVKKASQQDIEGCAIFCRFVNSFRAQTEQWDTNSLQTWSALQSFMLYSPNCQKICLEVNKIKKQVLRPHISRVQPQTYEALQIIRKDYLQNFSEKSIGFRYKLNPNVKKLVLLVFTSINHLLPAQPQQEEDSELPPQEEIEVPQQESSSGNQSAIQDEVVDLQTANHTQNIPTQDDHFDQQEASWSQSPSPAKKNDVANVEHGNQQLILQSSQVDDQSFAGISYADLARIQQSTFEASQVQQELEHHQEEDQYTDNEESNIAVSEPKQAYADMEESADQDQDHQQQFCQETDEGQADVASSRGSAWPSETSRLTPHQSTYQINTTANQHAQQFKAQPSTKTKKVNKIIINKEEPMTELKRVPYRITHNEMGDMFGDHSYSSSFDKFNQVQVSNAQNDQKQTLQQQQQSSKSTINFEQIVNMTKMNQKTLTDTNLSKEERIKQLQAAQQLIQQQISELLEVETKHHQQQDEEEQQEELSQPAVVLPGLMARMQQQQEESAASILADSPVRKFKTLTTTIESPDKFSQIKATLAIRQESVGKEIDSILGASPSPQKIVERVDWTLVSPEKFALKLDKVDKTVVEEVSNEQKQDSSEMSSHDLTAEEEDEMNRLQPFVERDQAGTLASQRDRQTDMTNLNSDDQEQTCSEIQLCFSPTKLQECFVTNHTRDANARLHRDIEKHERDMQNRQTHTHNIREALDQRLAQRIQQNKEDGAQGIQDSPNTRNIKYKQMQNEIFNKIQAQLQNM